MVYVVLAEGFEEIEALTPVDLLRRAGIETFTVGVGGTEIAGGQGITVKCDTTIDKIDYEGMDMLVLPGGKLGVDNLFASGEVKALLQRAYDDKKLIGAICAAPTILGRLGMLEGRRAVCYPGCEDALIGAKLQLDERVTSDDNIITGEAAGSSVSFALKLIAMLRGWQCAEKVRQAIRYERNERSLT